MDGFQPGDRNYRQSRFHHTNVYQELDQLGLFQSVSKYNVQVRHTARIREAVRNAFRIAVSGNPRPVHLDFIDEAVIGETESRVSGESDLYQTYPGSRVRPDEGSVRSACTLLQHAERPVIFAGHGAIMSQAWDEILELSELPSVPVATTLSGKDSISETHSLALGVAGQYSRNCANQIVGEADLVFFIGCKTGGLATNNQEVPAKGTPIIHLDIDTHEIGRNYPTEAAIVGDAKLGLQACLTELRKLNPVPSKDDWAKHVQQIIEEWHKEAQRVLTSEQSPIHPARVIHEIRGFLDDDDVVVADTGYMGVGRCLVRNACSGADGDPGGWLLGVGVTGCTGSQVRGSRSTRTGCVRRWRRGLPSDGDGIGRALRCSFCRRDPQLIARWPLNATFKSTYTMERPSRRTRLRMLIMGRLRTISAHSVGV